MSAKNTPATRGFVDCLIIEFLAKHGLFPGSSTPAKVMV
jgi:hypothetical protein